MKLRNLLALTALAACCAANAQKDITSEYITNATLADGTNGWVVNNFNAPQKGNNTVGYASEAYAGWGNLDVKEYSLTQKITLPKGSYQLANYSFFRQGISHNTQANKSLGYLKAGDKQVAIKTLGSIQDTYYANSQADGANVFDSKMYRNTVDFEIDADGTEIEIGLVGTFDLKQSWCIAGMFELFDLNEDASVDNPVDVTYLIKNPGFEYRNVTGWDRGDVKFQYQGSDALPSKSGIGFAERWQAALNLSDSKFTQVVAVPAGLYRLSAIGQNVEQPNGSAQGTGMYFFCGDQKVEVVNNEVCTTEPTLVNNGQVTIGVELSGCTGNWVSFDNFKLEYLGVDLSELQTNLAIQRETLAGLDVTGIAPKYAALQEEVLSSTAGTYNTKKAIKEATDKVVNAINEIKDAITLANAINSIVEEYAEKVAALDEKGQESYENSGAATAEYATESEAKDAIVAAYLTAVKAQGEGSNMTAAAPTAWQGESGIVGWANHDDNLNNGSEKFSGSMYTGDVMTMTINGLQPGTYTVTLYGSASTTGARDNFEVLTGKNRAYFFANDALQSMEVYNRTEVEAGTADKAVLTCGVKDDGILRIGIENKTMGANWFVIRLESIVYESANLKTTDVQLAVSDAHYSTFIAPFAAKLPEGVTAYTVDAIEEGNVLAMTVKDAIEANVPVVLHSESPIEKTLTGVSEAEGATYTVGLLTGVYAPVEITAGYVLQNGSKGVMFYAVSAEDAITVPANKAYLTAPADAKVINLPAVATAIKALTTGGVEAIYNANGVQQNSLQKGMNIVKLANGQTQKILVK